MAFRRGSFKALTNLVYLEAFPPGVAIPGKVLAAIERDHLPGDRRRIEQEADGAANLLDRGAAAEAASLRHSASNSASLCHRFLSTGPGPMALTRMRGASAWASVCVAVHSADLAMV